MPISFSAARDGRLRAFSASAANRPRIYAGCAFGVRWLATAFHYGRPSETCSFLFGGQDSVMKSGGKPPHSKVRRSVHGPPSRSIR